jgi:hypothetical protein
MTSFEARNFEDADKSVTPEKTRVDIVNVGGNAVGRYTFSPGWRWVECLKPVVGTDSCQIDHLGYVVSGTLHVRHSDGSEGEVSAGDVYRLSPGHEGWVVGDEPFVSIEFKGMEAYTQE